MFSRNYSDFYYISNRHTSEEGSLKNGQSIKLNHSIFVCCRDLRFNKIREIPAHAFKDLKHLNTL